MIPYLALTWYLDGFLLNHPLRIFAGGGQIVVSEATYVPPSAKTKRCHDKTKSKCLYSKCVKDQNNLKFNSDSNALKNNSGSTITISTFSINYYFALG